MQLYSLQSIGALAWYVISLICRTLRIERRGSDDAFYRDGGTPMIYAVWHGRMTVPLYCRKNRGVAILVSEHRDGELVTSTVSASGNRTIRGSTTRGGSRALVQLVRAVRNGGKIAITPDGPRGPRWKVQPGIIYLAAKSGVPIIPITGSSNRAYYFRSWDTFQLPLPFSRAVLVIGEPYMVSGGIDEANIEYHRAEVEKRLVELTGEADRIAGASQP